MTTNIFKPILFNTEMVQAILAGRKTQTRRIIKSRDESGIFQVCKNFDGKVTSIESLDWDERNCEKDILSKYQIDDILWVRETFQKLESVKHKEIDFLYKADVEYHNYFNSDLVVWSPSIHMPKEAARIFLKVTNVRVERLQDISEEDAIAEGVELGDPNKGIIYRDYLRQKTFFLFARLSFKSLWDSINAKKHPWESNPWVWVYDFERIEKPENFI